VHVVFDLCAVSPEYVFAGQLVHSADPSVSLKVPAVHGKHVMDVSAKLPIGCTSEKLNLPELVPPAPQLLLMPL
jgi:hypothetical protein